MHAKSFKQPRRKVYIVTEGPRTPLGAEDLQIMEGEARTGRSLFKGI